MKRRKVNLKLDRKNQTQCPAKQHAEDEAERLNTTPPCIADSSLDLTVTYDYNMPAYVGPVKSNSEIVQLFTIDESPHRQPKRLSVSTPQSFHSTAKMKNHRKHSGTSVSPEDLRRFEELAHQLVECRGPLNLEAPPPRSCDLEAPLPRSCDLEAPLPRSCDLEAPPKQDHECQHASLLGDDDFDNLLTSEELCTLDNIICNTGDRLSLVYAPPTPVHAPPTFQSREISHPSSICYLAPPPGYVAPPPGYVAPPPGYVAPPPGYVASPPSYLTAHPKLCDDQDDDCNFWTSAADLLDSTSLEPLSEGVPKKQPCSTSPCSSSPPHSSSSCSFPTTSVVLADCSNVPLLLPSSQPQKCSQEDIAQKRHRALLKLAARKCKHKAS